MSDTDPRSDDERRKPADELWSPDVAADDEMAEGTTDPNDATTIINDNNDEPHFPDEQTVAETTAAQSAIWNPPSRTQKKRSPKSLLILLAVLVGIFGLGAYVVWWSNHLLAKNEMIELRKLEGRVVMAEWQKKYMSIRFPQGGIAPAGVVYKPLTPAENARYQALMAKYKDRREPFEPDANEKLLIDETKKLQGIE